MCRGHEGRLPRHDDREGYYYDTRGMGTGCIGGMMPGSQGLATARVVYEGSLRGMTTTRVVTPRSFAALRMTGWGRDDRGKGERGSHLVRR